MLAQDAQFLLAGKVRQSGKHLNRNKVSPRSKLQQLLDRHLSNSGCNVSGDPKVKRWHEPETGGRRCHRLLAGRVLMFNPELVRVLCEKIASETDPQKLREMNLLSVIKEVATQAPQSTVNKRHRRTPKARVHPALTHNMRFSCRLAVIQTCRTGRFCLAYQDSRC